MDIGKHEFEEITAGTGLGIDLTPDAAPAGITRGPDGNMWFTESGADRQDRPRLPRADGRAVARRGRDPDRRPPHGRRRRDQGARSAPTRRTRPTTSSTAPTSSTARETEEQSAGHEADPMTENVELPLEPSSHYHARLVANNGAGETASPDLELWTDELGRISDFDPAPAVDRCRRSPPTPTPTPEPGNSAATAAPPATATRPPASRAAAESPRRCSARPVVVRPVSGSIRVKAPGACGYSALAAGANMPVGTLVDTRAGKIVLQSARNAHGRTQNGTFWGGVFQIRQGRKSKGMTDLHLRGGGFGRCGTRAGTSVSPTSRAASAASSAASGARTSTRASAPTAATASPPCAARSGSPPTAATARGPRSPRARSSSATCIASAACWSAPATPTSPGTATTASAMARGRGRDGMAILVAVLIALALALVAKDAHLLDGVEDETVAMRFQARGAQVDQKVAVVAIDDVTFSDLERQWPFPRSLHGRAIDALRKAGARRIVYDVQFTEPTSEREDLALFRAISRADDVVLATTETDGRGGTNVLGGDENVRAAGAHAAAANLETDRGGVIHRFPYSSGGLRSVAVVAAELSTGRRCRCRRSTTRAPGSTTRARAGRSRPTASAT